MNNQINELAKAIVLRFLDEDDPRFQEEYRAVVQRITKFVIDAEMLNTKG